MKEDYKLLDLAVGKMEQTFAQLEKIAGEADQGGKMKTSILLDLVNLT